MAVGLSCAGSGMHSAVSLLEPLLTDAVDFVRQGALVATALVLIQQPEEKVPAACLSCPASCLAMDCLCPVLQSALCIATAPAFSAASTPADETASSGLAEIPSQQNCVIHAKC